MRCCWLCCYDQNQIAVVVVAMVLTLVTVMGVVVDVVVIVGVTDTARLDGISLSFIASSSSSFIKYGHIEILK